MKLIKKCNGKAKCPADLAKIEIILMTKNQHKNELLTNYIDDYDKLLDVLNGLIQKYNLDNLSFEKYYAAEEYKTVKTIKNDKELYNKILDYYYIEGLFTLDIEIKNNDRRVIAEFINLLDKFSNVKYKINYTLKESTFASMRAAATNNALDNIEIEVKQIADHLGLKTIELCAVNFEAKSYSYRSGNLMYDMDASASSEEKKIELLEQMMQSKDIEVISEFVSIWDVY